MAVICFLGTLVSSAEEPLWTATFDEIPSSGYFRTERTQSDPVSGLLDAVAAVLSEPVTQADNITYEVVFQSLGGEWSTFTRFGLFAVPGDFLENCLNIYGDSGAAATFYGYVEGGGGSSIQFVPGTSTAFNEPRFLRYTYTAADRNEHVLMVKGTDDSATGEDVLVDWSPANIRIPEAAEFALTHFAFSDSSTNVFNFEWHLGVDRVTVWKNDQVVLNEEFDSGLGAFTVFSANGAKQAAWPACRLDGFHHMSGGTYDQQAPCSRKTGARSASSVQIPHSSTNWRMRSAAEPWVIWDTMAVRKPDGG